MATIPSKRAGDESPSETRRRTWFTPLATTWSPRRTPGHFNPLGGASETTAEPAIVPGQAVMLRTDNRA